MTATHIVLIIVVVMAFSTLQSWIKRKDRKPRPDPEAENVLQKIDVLEERIRVLERIVTEHNIDLRQQIDSL